MKYVNSTLIQGEEIILAPALHRIVYVKPFIFFGVISFLLLLMGCLDRGKEAWTTLGVLEALLIFVTLLWYLYDKLYYTRFEMAVTNKRVVAKTGIISVHSEELQWNKIESIEIRQGIWGRWLNYGDIYFSGTGTSFVRFEAVQNPWDVKAKSAEILSN